MLLGQPQTQTWSGKEQSRGNWFHNVRCYIRRRQKAQGIFFQVPQRRLGGDWSSIYQIIIHKKRVQLCRIFWRKIFPSLVEVVYYGQTQSSNTNCDAYESVDVVFMECLFIFSSLKDLKDKTIQNTCRTTFKSESDVDTIYTELAGTWTIKGTKYRTKHSTHTFPLGHQYKEIDHVSIHP